MATQTGTETATATANSKHYNDWPNAAAFNALEDRREEVKLEVTGQIPDYAAGILYRTGPGGYKVPRNDGNGDIAASHWFDGFTTVHKFQLQPSEGQMKVSYSSYGQVDKLIQKAKETGRFEGISFGQKRDPCDSFFKKLKTTFQPSQLGADTTTANIGVALRPTMQGEKDEIVKNGAKIDGRKLMTVTTDAATTKHFDADTLEPLGCTTQTALHPSLTGPLAAAHAEFDPVNGDVYNYNLAFGARPAYRIWKASPSTGKVEVLATITGNDIKPAYLHSMLSTENFIILCIWPAHFGHAGIDMLWTRNLLDAIQPMDGKSDAVWVVVDRKHGRGVVKKFTSPAFYCFHTINAWEEKNADGSVDISAELFQFNDTEILHKFYYENMVSDEKSTNKYCNSSANRNIRGGIARYKLSNVPIKAGVSVGNAKNNIAERVKYISGPDAGELPVINRRFKHKQHRYVYGITDRGLSSFVDGLVKTDTETGQALIWDHPKHTPGEAIFVRDPAGTAEDDGVILSVVLDGVAGTSYLLCLDARTMKELGRAEVGRPVGLGFHGVHLPQKVL